MKSQFICPYCFTRHPLSEVEFRCTNRRCKQVDDIPMTKYEFGDVKMPKKGGNCFPVRMKGSKLPDSGTCPLCGETTYKMVCPSCHNPLPEATLNGTDMIISVVGARGTGKSVFVGILINELMKRVAPAFGGALNGFDDSYNRYKATFFQRMYIDKRTPEQTQSGLSNADNGAYRPYIFTLRLPKKSLFGNKVDSFTFVFFDTAGEDLDDEDTMSTVNKYITSSSGIIFLLDPLQIPEVVNQLSQETVRGASAANLGSVTDPNSIMTSVSHLIRKSNKLSTNRLIDIPVAAVFSKFDAIEEIVPEDMAILRTSPHTSEGVFDMADFNNVNNEVKGLLNAWNYGDFIRDAQINYSNCAFFAVSALGLHNNPKAGSIDMPKPHRIEDPLLWILEENGVIKATKKK